MVLGVKALRLGTAELGYWSVAVVVVAAIVAALRLNSYVLMI